MKIFLRFSFFVFVVFLSYTAQAEKLYWIEGSGNFNDAHHWSLASGGKGGAKIPTATDDVYFDENSFLGESVISFVGNTEVHDFIFAQYTPKVIFQGMQHEKITIHGNLSLNPYIDNRFVGDIVLASDLVATTVSFNLCTLKGNLYFDANTNWAVEGSILGDDNVSVYFKQGIINLTNTSINAGNLIASPGVTINTLQTVFIVKNKFILPAGITLNDSKSTVYAHVKDPVTFQVSPAINFNTNSRLNNVNNTLSSCNITMVSSSQPTCSGSCNGTIVFNIPAATCSGNDTIVAMWNNAVGNTHQDTTFFTLGNTPTTYSVNNLCSSSNQYVITFANNIIEDTVYNNNTPFSVSMANPAPPQIHNVNPTPPTCFGLCNGYLALTLFNSGAFTQTSHWTSSTFTGTVTHPGITVSVAKDTLKNACAGTYSVFLTDANGCPSATVHATVTQPGPVVSTFTVTNPLCNGSCSGVITAANSGGTGAITCTMDSSGGVFNSPMPGCTASGLCAGTYTISGKDAHGCKDSSVVTITPPPAITLVQTPASGTLNIPCRSACSGSVSVSAVSGGVAPYTFSWTPAGGTVSSTPTASTYFNLCTGSYTCTIKDANGCTKTTTYTVNAPAALTLTPTFTNPKCHTGPTGSATVTATGGAPAFSFTWSPLLGAPSTTTTASPKTTYSNILGGTYTVIATDANGCMDTTTVTLTPPSALTATMTTIVNPTCPNVNNGHLCVTVGGGTPGLGYTYSWTPSSGTASCTPATLVSGTYTATVTDANSCTVTVSTTLVPPPPVIVSSSTTQPTCAGFCNGSATLTPTSGLAPFSYQWSCSGSTLPTIVGQCGGTTCNYTVTDANNCKTTGSVSFISPSNVILSLTSTSLTCAGQCSGSIMSHAAGGTGLGTYSYTWTGVGVVANAQNQNNLCAGNYTCNITDANNCPATATTSIATPAPLSITLTPTDPNCSGGTGSILGSISGGSPAYAHTWSPPIAPNPTTSINPNNLPTGVTYSFEVTDANGCIDSDTLTLISPPPVAITLVTTSVTCTGQCNGTASVTASGGTSPFTYSWDGGSTFGTTTFTTNLCQGTYTLVVKDNKGCLATQFFTIAQPTPLNVSVINIQKTCNGLCNGGGTASVSGGIPTYAYSWDASGPYVASDSMINTLCIGTHTLYVQDANGCKSSATFNITPLVNIAISISSNTVSCHNACDATGTASASGSPNTPYTIQWVNPSITCSNVATGAPCSASGLCSGTQTIVATDNLGCSSTTTISIVNPSALAATATTTTVFCFGQCTGSATVTPSGGTPAYTINWNPPAGFSGTTGSNLCPGTYTANILDHNGCSLTQTVSVGVSGQFVVTPTFTNPSSCGSSNGAIGLAISGGSGTYTVSWLPSNITTNPLTNIPAGSYTATITDANGCDTVITYGLGNTAGPVMNYTVSNATCFGLCNGTATVVASGANSPFQVDWQGPPVVSATGSITVNNLCGDSSTNYLVKATNAIGCITFTTVTVTSPTQIKDHSTSIQPTCGGSNGSITLAPSGGGGSAYSFSWNGGATNNPHGGLLAGTDTVIITDGVGCMQTYTYNLISVNSPSVTVSTSSVTCSYLTNGTATATATGGTPAYSYTWTGSGGIISPSGVNISTISNLSGGSYSLSITDTNNCSAQTTFTVAEPVAINPNFWQQNVLCNGGSTGSASVSPTGGASGFTYTWTTPSSPTTQSVTSLFSGTYSVIVEDANFCTDTVKFTITEPTTFSVSTIESTQPTCDNGTNGSATVTVSGGVSPYTYTWSPNVNHTAIASNLSAGCYTVTAQDSNSCITSTFVCISNPTPINPNVTSTNPTCGGNCNGSITSTPSGGTSPYIYSWSPSGFTINTTTTSSTYSNLCVNSYTLVVTDANSCADTIITPLNAPASSTINYTTSLATCGVCNGSITITTSTVTVIWLNTSCGSALTCNSLCAGTYSVQVTNPSLCVDTIVIPLSNSNGPVVVPSSTNVTCNADSNGAALVTVSGGTTPYTYGWTPASPGTVISTTATSLDSGLQTGTYFSTVTDAAGCITITNYTITEPSGISDNATVNSASCVGVNNGTITIAPSGGTSFSTGYLYASDGGTFTIAPSTSYTYTGLSAGSHTVCIKDSVSCTKCFVYNLSATTTIVSTISGTNTPCFNSCNGVAAVSNINGGTAPYALTWNNLSQVGTTVTNLCAGSYTAIITDNVGCQAIDTITIMQPSTISPNSNIIAPSCGQCNGSITLNATGGNGSVYNYSWTPVGNTNTITNVCAGPYQVEVADNLGCTQIFVIPVSSLNSPTVTLTVTNVTCFGSCNGAINTTVTGGTTPYTYLWPVGTQTTSSINNQCAGNYIVEVQDSLGCINTQSVSITSPLSFTINTTNISPSCNTSNGVITTTVVGSSTYSYQWSANAGSVTTSSVSGLGTGTYTLVVTDSISSCTQTKVIILNNSSGPSLTVTTTDVTCNGLCNGSATLVATGGTTPYNPISWNTAPPQTGTLTATNLCGNATYQVQVTDAVGCIQTAQVIINQPSILTAGLPIVTPIQCNNSNNGAINTVVFGGTPAYTYSWTPNTIVGSNAINLGAGTYSVTITDVNGCPPINIVETFTNPPALLITGTVTPSSCNNAADGSIITLTSGGTLGISPAYSWQWSGASNATTQSLPAILPGNYTVMVTDSRLCKDSASFAVLSTISIMVNAGKDTALCNNTPIVLIGTVTGALSFDWQTISGTILSTNTLTQTINPASTTQYVLLAQNGVCINSDTITASISPAAVANAGPSQSINIGQTATIGGNPTNPSGGTIVWIPNIALSDTTAENPIASPSSTTIYTVIITNSAGCKATDTIVVTILPPFVIPTGFTPNGDGKNDLWIIDNINLFPGVEIEVYNRWGEQLFYSKGNYSGWNGTYTGKPVPVGTYYYIIRLNDSRYPDHYAGPLTILR